MRQAMLLFTSFALLAVQPACTAQLSAGLPGAVALAPTPTIQAPVAAPPAPAAVDHRARSAPPTPGDPEVHGFVEGEARAAVSLEVDITFYGIPLRGANDLVFVLDRSGSMDGSKLAHAKAELRAVIDALPDGTRIGLIFFNTRLRTLTSADFAGRLAAGTVAGGGGGKVAAWASGVATNVAVRASGHNSHLVALDALTRPTVKSFIDGITATGGTAAVPAMRRAYELGARHLVFLSDGLANSGGSPRELLAEAEDHARGGIRIDTVGLGGDQDQEVLQGMARASGGTAVVY